MAVARHSSDSGLEVTHQRCGDVYKLGRVLFLVCNYNVGLGLVHEVGLGLVQKAVSINWGSFVRGCPYNKSPTSLGWLLRHLIFGNSHAKNGSKWTSTPKHLVTNYSFSGITTVARRYEASPQPSDEISAGYNPPGPTAIDAERLPAESWREPPRT